jgi:hypothetical protein
MKHTVESARENGVGSEVKVKSSITVELFDKTGKRIKTVSADRVTTVGVDAICNRVGRITPGTKFASGFGYILVGTSAVAPAANQVALIGPISGKLFGSRLEGSFAHPVGSNYFRVYRTVGPGTCTGNWQESALYNYQRIAAGSKILNRGTIAAVNKTATDSARITHQVAFTV